MKRRSLQPGELDRIGKKLIASARLSEGEIEKISASPFLFETIRTETAETFRLSAEAVEHNRFAAWVRPLAFAFSSVGALLIVAAVGIYVMREAPSNVAQNPTEPKTQPALSVPQAVKPAGDTVNDPIPDIEPDPQPVAPQLQNASYRRPEPKRIQRPVAEKLPDIEFYPITHQGDPNEMARGGRIIRVEMSRSALFAMGVNVPLENGAEMITADLLVGPDGVTRAIRMPNQNF